MKTFLNIEKIIQWGLLFLLLLQTGLLFVNNKIGLLINPRFTVLILVSALVIIIFMLYLNTQLFSTVKPVNSLYKTKYLLLLVMIVLMGIPTYSDYQANISRLRGVTIGNETVYNDQADTGNKIMEPDTKQIPKPGNNRQNTAGNTDLVFTNNNFLALTYSIYNNLEKNNGKTISIKGFVYRFKGIPEGHFIIARLAMMCCAADASITGFFCTAPEIYHSFNNNEWYTIKGVLNIKKTKVNNQYKNVPVILIKEYIKTKKNRSPYVYP